MKIQFELSLNDLKVLKQSLLLRQSLQLNLLSDITSLNSMNETKVLLAKILDEIDLMKKYPEVYNSSEREKAGL